MWLRMVTGVHLTFKPSLEVIVTSRQSVCSIALLLCIELAASISFPARSPARAVEAASGPIVVLANEATAGDLNGDGDATDYVVQIGDGKTATTNLRLAVSTVCRETFSPPFVSCQPVSPVTDGSIVAILVGESSQTADLNGDGDTTDDVLYVYDAKSAQLVNTRLAVPRATGRDTSSYTFPVLPVVTGGGVALLVGETEQGAIDLNGDGDTQDDVLHVIQPKSLSTVNLKLAAATVFGPFGSHNPISPALDHQTVTFQAGEPEQGADLNGDGDSVDQVAYRLHLQNGQLKLE
jgi:hypothetical protein